MFKNVTWQQTVLCLGLVAAAILTMKFLPDAAPIVNSILMTLAFFKDPSSQQPVEKGELKVIDGGKKDE